MWDTNQGQTEDEILRNYFTGYLTKAVQRRMKDYQYRINKYRALVTTIEAAEMDETLRPESRLDEGLPVLMRLQNEFLLEALLTLGEREQYILLNYAMKERTFAELSQELGLSYKGIAAIYYRAIQKVRKRMGDHK